MNGTAGDAPGGLNGTPGQPDGQIAQGGSESFTVFPALAGGGGSYGDITGTYLGGRNACNFDIELASKVAGIL